MDIKVEKTNNGVTLTVNTNDNIEIEELSKFFGEKFFSEVKEDIEDVEKNTNDDNLCPICKSEFETYFFSNMIYNVCPECEYKERV